MKGNILRRYFLTGIFVLLPIAAAALVITWLFGLLDDWAIPLTQRYFGHHIPGLGFFAALLIIFFTGALASNVMGQYLLRWIDMLFMELPVFRSIYNTTKQVMQVFSPDSQNSFKSVVLVEHPKGGGLGIGFVTHELELVENGKKEKRLAVYVPTNHLYFGDIYLFRPQEVRNTSLSVQQGVQSIISAGAILPAELQLTSSTSTPDSKPL